jgi:hypothetical protein
MKIGLFYKMPNRMVGCWKVANNLIRGLQQLNIQVSENKIEEYNGSIHGSITEFENRTLPKNTLIGPEIMVLPTDMSWVWQTWNNLVQPSQWVVDYMRTFPITKNNKLWVWSVGIDTNQFNDDNKNITTDCFIYYKNVTHQTPISKLNNVTNVLKSKNISYKVIEYGNYNEDQLKQLCKTCKFCIMLCGTESQGIAYMEILSSGVPMYVIDEKTFKYSSFTFTNDNVSSAPYFNNECGIKTTDINSLDLFINNLDKYNPRKYILENHTLKIGAQKYVDILLQIGK